MIVEYFKLFVNKYFISKTYFLNIQILIMSKKKSTKRDDYKKEDILQAVIIADSFENRFAPITLSKPKV